MIELCCCEEIGFYRKRWHEVMNKLIIAKVWNSLRFVVERKVTSESNLKFG